MDQPTLQKLLVRFNIHPSKQKGQNFLIDESHIQTMVDAADIKRDDAVLEIGPGLGVLTQALRQQTDQLCLVELEKKLIPYIRETFVGENAHLIEGDVLSRSFFFEFVQWLYELRHEQAAPDPKDEAYKEVLASLDHQYKIVANLPYQITSRMLRKFLTALPRPSLMVLMLQKEVAERMTAAPGGTSLLSLAVQTASTPEIIARVPKDAFFPSPDVESVVIRCDLMKPNERYARLCEEEQKLFWRLAKAGFAARRKMLKKNLSGLSFDISWGGIFAEVGLDENTRAQELSIEDWVSLTEAVKRKGEEK